MSDLKSMYKTVVGDPFPQQMKLTLGDREMVFRKRTWTIDGETKGLRYGENPDQPAALYEPVSGALDLGEVRFRGPGKGVVSSLDESGMLQAGKHPGKINLTDVDNGANILQYLTAKPAAVILKHNNPCGAAWTDKGLGHAIEKAFRSDRIAAFGGAVVVNRPMTAEGAEVIDSAYFEVVAAPLLRKGLPGHPQEAQEPAHPGNPPPGRTGNPFGRALPGDEVPDRRRRGGPALLQKPHPHGRRLPARRGQEGRRHLHRRKARQAGDGRPPLRLGSGGRGDLQLRALRPGRGHRCRGHGRAGPGGVRADHHRQGLHQVRRPLGLPGTGHVPVRAAPEGRGGHGHGRTARGDRGPGQAGAGRASGLGGGLGRLLSLPGRGGPVHRRGGDGHRPARGVHPGLGGDRGLQPGRAPGGYGIHRQRSFKH